VKYLRAFFAFLYDFLVGDAWELFVGPIIALFAAWALIQLGVDHWIVGVALVLAVIVIATSNVITALRHSA